MRFAVVTVGFLLFMPAALCAQTQGQQSATHLPPVKVPVTQEEMCCFDMKFVEPVYPRAARLANTQGEVKLYLLLEGTSIVDLHAVSGDPVLVKAAMDAASQWTFRSTIGGVLGLKEPHGQIQLEIPITFVFEIENPPKPAFLHLADGKVVKADDVREYEDGFEYSAGGRTHKLPSEKVITVDQCRTIAVMHLLEKYSCIPSGGPNFTIRAMPLLPGKSHSPESRN